MTEAGAMSPAPGTTRRTGPERLQGRQRRAHRPLRSHRAISRRLGRGRPLEPRRSGRVGQGADALGSAQMGGRGMGRRSGSRAHVRRRRGPRGSRALESASRCGAGVDLRSATLVQGHRPRGRCALSTAVHRERGASGPSGTCEAIPQRRQPRAGLAALARVSPQLRGRLVTRRSGRSEALDRGSATEQQDRAHRDQRPRATGADAPRLWIGETHPGGVVPASTHDVHPICPPLLRLVIRPPPGHDRPGARRATAGAQPPNVRGDAAHSGSRGVGHGHRATTEGAAPRASR